jgi:hypothetical protein
MTTGAALIASALHDDIKLPFLKVLSEPQRSFWVSILDRLILGFSDQQLVSGISILIVGFIKLPQGISTYHFTLITSLAMFSCSAHLASVLSLRRYFQKNREVAKIRITLMALFAILLSISLLMVTPPIVSPSMASIIFCPAIFRMNHSDTAGRFVSLFLAVYLGVCYWAALSLVIRRNYGGKSEAEWGFGQILAVLITLIPFLSGIETYYGKSLVILEVETKISNYSLTEELRKRGDNNTPTP